jgi:polyphosphate kinase
MMVGMLNETTLQSVNDIDNLLLNINPQTRYLNRELSSIEFNKRVMEQAKTAHNPLLERVKFLGISANILDEFTMVRVAGIKEQVRNKIFSLSDDGLTPLEQITELVQVMRNMLVQQQNIWITLKQELEMERIFIVKPSELEAEQFQAIKDRFFSDIFPAISPIAIDPAHPFPFLPNKGLAQIFELKNNHSGKLMNAVVPIPTKLDRFQVIENKTGCYFLLLEDLILEFAELLFPSFTVESNCLFRILRDSDLDVEEDAEDLLRNYEHAVKKRRRGRIIRIKALHPAPPHLVQFFTDHVESDIYQVHEMEGMLGLSDLSELYRLNRPDLKYQPYSPRYPERITEYGEDCFAAIAAKDIIIHHPYETFDVVVQFVEQAASDPDVIAIKQTLYRTSDNSPIVKALIRAAESGKSVTALVELRARFDEEANIRWARDLEGAGVQVVYGFVGVKTHAKISIVVRREKQGIVSYAHFGTGNYHPITAKIYTDLSYFTCNKDLVQEAHFVFNYVTGYGSPEKFHHVIPAPLHMRRHILNLIAQEANNAKAGKPAHIWAKMNSLVDTEIIDSLYIASQAGVKIELVVRGICCLRPQVKGLSENIHVKSIVGRFLEHSRIYCFGNGHALPSPNALVYIGSADWMTRNLDWRVEIMVPITNETVHTQVLEQIMVANLRDDVNSWELQPNGEYAKIENKNNFCSHKYFMENPSLSGRGSSILKKGTKSRKKKN